MNSFFASIGGWLQGLLLFPAGLYFLATIPLVVLLYLLKLRRTELIISSTFLWHKSLQDLTANAPFQKLRKNLLLFLQILILLLLILGLSRPFIKTEGITGTSFCLLIDRSASMNTEEDSGTRLELAKRKAVEIIDDMSQEDKMMLVTFAESASVLSELTDDRPRLRAIINSIEPSDCRTRIGDAANVAHSLQQNVIDLRLVVITDGNIDDLDETSVSAMSPVFVKVGESTDNLGITAFTVRADEEARGPAQALVRVFNQSTETKNTTLTLSYQGSPLAVEELVIDPEQDLEMIFALPDIKEGILKVEIDTRDDLHSDDAAWLVLRKMKRLRVLLVSKTDSPSAYYIKRALVLNRKVELSHVAPEDYLPTDDFDLTLFDSFTPLDRESMPTGTLAFFNVIPPFQGLRTSGTIDNPIISARDTDHPVMRFLSMEDITVREAFKVELSQEMNPLLVAEEGPLIADISQAGQRIVLLPFDIAETNWPLNLSFPIFFQNLIAWAPSTLKETEGKIHPGLPIEIEPEEGLEQAIMINPDGTGNEISLDPLRPVFYTGTEKVGQYQVNKNETKQYFAVSLLSRTESGIKPPETIALGRAEVQLQKHLVKQNRELWPYFILCALGILSLEWWIYSRRAWL